MGFNAAELILNSDGSIYHLNLLPEELADTVILVGDPMRVARVSNYFDYIETKKFKREFIVHTGVLNNQRMTVIGTGIGSGNIDIVINECDALANIDFKTRAPKPDIKRLRFVHIGTSGGLRAETPVNSFLISSYAIGLDNLMNFYDTHLSADEKQLAQACQKELTKLSVPPQCYVASGTPSLVDQLAPLGHLGMTLSCVGFYGPQHRQMRKPLRDNLFDVISGISHKEQRVLNLEMETASIFGLARYFGHDVCSISAIVANRETGEFSTDVESIIDQVIEKTLALL